MIALAENERKVDINESGKQPPIIAFFGHFDSTNFGNESSLQAMLYNIRRFQPDAKLLCISTGPEAASATHNIPAIPVAESLIEFWRPRRPVSKALRRICIAVPTEAYRWVTGFARLRHTDMLIIPGTGLLTDAYGFSGWGPYTLLRWSVIAKVCGCKLFFVSVGAGPIYSTLGRWSIKVILSLAHFRSYRDDTTLQCLKNIGFCTNNDPVYPDLAFSLPQAVIPRPSATKNRRCVIGIGVMGYAGKYSAANPANEIHTNYLQNLAIFARWLLARGYDIRLLIGDLDDTNTSRQFQELLRERISPCEEEHIVDRPIRSVDHLLSEIAATDIVVATRFHNVLLSLFCNKPVISISFHHKCTSLMNDMGLSRYCLDINDFRSADLIDRIHDIKDDYDNIKATIRDKARVFREALDEQYKRIFEN
jgi:polysaccharide pyruvyl transferase WcaK-like protein